MELPQTNQNEPERKASNLERILGVIGLSIGIYGAYYAGEERIIENTMAQTLSYPLMGALVFWAGVYTPRTISKIINRYFKK